MSSIYQPCLMNNHEWATTNHGVHDGQWSLLTWIMMIICGSTMISDGWCWWLVFRWRLATRSSLQVLWMDRINCQPQLLHLLSPLEIPDRPSICTDTFQLAKGSKWLRSAHPPSLYSPWLPVVDTQRCQSSVLLMLGMQRQLRVDMAPPGEETSMMYLSTCRTNTQLICERADKLSHSKGQKFQKRMVK